MQAQCLEAKPTRSQSTGYAAIWPALRTIPFAFQIPRTVPAETVGSSSYQDQTSHVLYPSAKIGRTYFDTANDKIFAQPFITYTLSASIRRCNTTEPFRRCISRPIKVMPTTSQPPPIDTTPFEGKYVRVARTKLRNTFFGRSFGSLVLSAEEPQAIMLPEQFSQSHTTVFLRIAFQHTTTGVKLKTLPCAWKFEVSSRLQRRVFCATHPLACIPTIADANGRSKIGLRTEILSTEKQSYEHLAWRNNHTTPHGTIPLSETKAASWITTLPIQLFADSSLLPSFFCATCSLRYAILLDIRVMGAWSSHSSLAVPVQIIYLARNMPRAEGDNEGISRTQLVVSPGGDMDASQELQPPEYRPSPF